MFDCSKGQFSFVLLDGHGSSADFEFLKCMNDASHEWAICIVVP